MTDDAKWLATIALILLIELGLLTLAGRRLSALADSAPETADTMSKAADRAQTLRQQAAESDVK